jgi:hypothetical protein
MLADHVPIASIPSLAGMAILRLGDNRARPNVQGENARVSGPFRIVAA